MTIDFTNPSAVTHDVCIDEPERPGDRLQPDDHQDSTSLSENLKPGKYTFFCSVDGHEARA